MRGLIGLGMIMMMPKVVEMIKNALKIEKGGAGVGGALAPMMGVAGMPGQILQQAIMLGQAKQYLMPPPKEDPWKYYASGNKPSTTGEA
jgi:hypothetical protein